MAGAFRSSALLLPIGSTPGQPNLPPDSPNKIGACCRLKAISPPSPKRSAKAYDLALNDGPLTRERDRTGTAFRLGAEIIARLNNRLVMSLARRARIMAAGASAIGAKSV
jgi:hypothetical protein